MRVVNTQGRAPGGAAAGLLVLAGWLVVALAAGRGRTAPMPTAPSRAERFALVVVPALVLLLLAAVTSDPPRAVEGAAAAGCALFAWGLRRLDGLALRAVLDEALALTGALFALLVAATSFSLLPALGTDRLVGEAMLASRATPRRPPARCWRAWPPAPSCSTPSNSCSWWCRS